jgi:hypothetical protein
MTHQLGAGTVNIALNVTREERSILGRMAFASGCSTGEFLRRKLRLGIAQTDPEAAKRLARLRRDRLRAVAMLALLCLHVATGGVVRRPARAMTVRGQRKEWVA